MSLDMGGFVDEVFRSVRAFRLSRDNGAYENGRWVQGIGDPSEHIVNLQPVADRKIAFLQKGGERVEDVRKVYVNDGDFYSISESDLWQFECIRGTFKTVEIDNRPWRNYCRLTVTKLDD